MSQLLGPFSVHRFGRQRNLPATSRRNEERKSFLRLSSNRMLQGKVLSWYRSSSTSDWDAISQWKWTRSQREAIVIDLKLSSSQRDKVKNFSEFQRVRMRCEIEWVATLFSNLQTATLRPAPTDWLTLTGGAGEQESRRAGRGGHLQNISHFSTCLFWSLENSFAQADSTPLDWIRWRQPVKLERVQLHPPQRNEVSLRP